MICRIKTLQAAFLFVLVFESVEDHHPILGCYFCGRISETKIGARAVQMFTQFLLSVDEIHSASFINAASGGEND